MKLNLSIDSLAVTKWYVDTAHAVNDDCKSHIGAALTFWKGVVTSLSCKQKLNRKSLTESEFIAVDNAIAQVLWTWYYIRNQGYQSGPSIIYQDNKSTILLETNRKGHIEANQANQSLVFLITDKVER